MEAARTAGRRITLMAKNKAATADPTMNRTETPRVDTDDLTILMATNKVPTVDPITSRTKTPRADTDDPTALTVTNKVPTVDPTTNRTKTPRATTDGRATLPGAAGAIMVGRTTIFMADRKPPTKAAPPVEVDPVITLTEAIREAMADRTVTTLVLMADRRNAAAVRCDCEFCNVC